jgi:DNA-binding GntR family transcriptional regulator
MERVVMTSRKEAAYKSLRYRIITQELGPGQKLNEKELMDDYEIGRTPIREILLELKKDGLVQIIPRSGTLVAPLDFHEFRQVIEIRTPLEGLAGALAAERISAEQLECLRDIQQSVDRLLLETGPNVEKLFQCESDFHGVVYEASANPKLMGILQELQGVCARFWHYLVFGEQELRAQLADQREMLAALEARDPQRSRKIMETHISNFSDQVKNHILGIKNTA